MSTYPHWLNPKRLPHWLRDEEIEERPSSPQGLPALPSSYQALHFNPSPSSSLFFLALPPELRRAIYLAAFGNRIVHIDLQYRHPDVHGPWHANLNKPPLFDVSVPQAWRWWSCVCHRQNRFAEDFYLDKCRLGDGHCIYLYHENGRIDCFNETGSKGECYVGVMGWMMSCRQAYMETVGILYSTNTMFIESIPLTSHISSLLPRHNLAMLTSLEFVWKMDISTHSIPWGNSENRELYRLERWKSYQNLMPLVNKSTFPRLQKLAIAAVGDNYNDGWIPSEIAAGSPTLPSQVIILLDPTDQIARDFDGQLRKFEITLPYHWANELEDKMGRNIKVAIILGGPAFCHKFWRTVPEGLDGRGELGYWILGGLRAPIGRGGYRA